MSGYVWTEQDHTRSLRMIRRHATHATRAARGSKRDKHLDRLVREVQRLILIERYLGLDELERFASGPVGVLEGEPITREDVVARIGRLRGETGLVLP